MISKQGLLSMGICWQHDVFTTSQITDVTTIQSNPPYLTE